MKTSSHRVASEASACHAGEVIGVSITGELGQRFRYHASTASMQMTRGVVQIVESVRGCFAWFEGCELEIREHRRTTLFRLRSGSASNDGKDLTIVAEIAQRPGGLDENEFADGVPARVSVVAPRKKQTAARKNPHSEAS